jgi:hypothetical protein
MRAPSHSTVRLVVGATIALTLIHFTDNAANIEDYGPRPFFVTVPTVIISWLAFTAVGLYAVRLHGQGRLETAGWFLVAYSFTGLISLGHFLTISPGELPTLSLVSVLIDAVVGTLVLITGLRVLRAGRDDSGIDRVTEAAA